MQRYGLSMCPTASQRAAENAVLSCSWKQHFLRIVLLLAALSVFMPANAFAARGVNIAYLPDASGAMTVKQAASPAAQGDYRAYVPSFMAFSSLPGEFNGAVWLRMTFAPAFQKPVGAVRIAFGRNLPGITKLSIPRLGEDGKETFVTMNAQESDVFFDLPDSEAFPDTLYVRFDGVPGLWFRPLVTQAPAEAPPFSLDIVFPGILAAALLVMLLQYVRKAEEWRVWAAVAAGCGIASAFMPPTPAAGAAFTPLAACAMALPGIIVLLLTHTVRHMFATPSAMPGFDRFLALYYLAGICLALVPLVPGYLWVSRYVPLWAFLVIPLVPTATMASSRSLRGAFLFMLAALLVIFGGAFAAWELTQITLPKLGGSGSLWGFSTSMLLLAFIGPTASQEKDAQQDDVFDSLDRSASERDAIPAEAVMPQQQEAPPLPEYAPADAGGVLQLRPEDTVTPAPDPVAPAIPAEDELPYTPVLQEFASEQDAPAPILHIHDEEAATPTETTSLKPLPQEATNAAMRDPVATFIEDATQDGDSAEEQTETVLHGHAAVFDLPLIVKEAHDIVAPVAEKKNIGLTWFIAPQTGRLFEGEADLLRSTLQRLLRDMVNNLTQGNVRLNVRRLPDSSDAGNLVFTLVEWNARHAYRARPLEGLAEAWALAEKTGGFFSVEHTPKGGSTVIFSALFSALDKPKAPEEDALPASTDVAPKAETPASESAAQPEATKILESAPVQVFTDYPDIEPPSNYEPVLAEGTPAGIDAETLLEDRDPERDPLRVIVVEAIATRRAAMSVALPSPPYTVLESDSPAAASALYARHPSALLVMDASMPEMDIAQAIRNIHQFDAECGFAPALFLTLVDHEGQGKRMKRAGSLRTLIKPVSADALLEAVTDLVPAPLAALEPKSEETIQPAPLPLPQADTAARPESPKDATPQEQTEPLASVSPAAPDPKATGTTSPASLPAPEEAIPPAEQLETPKEPAPLEQTPGIPEPTFVSADEHAGTAPSLSVGMEDVVSDKRSSGPGLELLDMIITDEPEIEPDQSKETAPAQPVVAEVMPAPAAQPAAKAPLPTKPHSSATITIPANRDRKQTPQPTPERRETASITLRKKESTAPAQPQTPQGTETQSVQPAAVVPPVAAVSLPDVEQAPQAVPAQTSGIPSNPQSPDRTASQEPQEQELPPQQPVTIPLPGEEDRMYEEKLPLIPGLLYDLADAMRLADTGKKGKDATQVRQAAEQIAEKAQSFGLFRLERMARCVERAAAAEDVEPMECVLEDLEQWIARYKEALRTLHRNMQW